MSFVRWSGVVAAVVVLCVLLLITALPLPFHLTALLTLTWFLPGLLLVSAWQLPDTNTLIKTVLAAGLGLCWMVGMQLVVHLIPGPISFWGLIGAHLSGIAVLTPFALRCLATPTLPDWRMGQWGLVLVILFAALLRFPGLDYHEFHFDESFLLTRAREAIRGEDDAFFKHTKGPGEIAIATTLLRGLDTVNEATGRFPFALASVLSVVAVVLLGQRLFQDKRVGLIAGVLLAINGFALGLSRIVQYQGVMLLLTALTFLVLWEFAQRGGLRWLYMGLVFSTVGIIMHYEFALMAPVLLLLAWQGWRRTDDRFALARMLAAGTVAASTAGFIYYNLFTNPYYERITQVYAKVRMGQPGNWNGSFFVEIATLYNSIYFLVALIALVIAGMAWGFSRRETRYATALLTLWFAPYFILYFFVVEFPGTHFYMMMESWSLLAALPIAAMMTLPATRPVRWAAGAFAGVGVAVSVGYLYLVFFQQSPEYVMNYPATRVPLYWTFYGDNIPAKPRFGFPIQEGWKVLGVLSESHDIGGTYASNERSNHLRWYLSGLERVDWDEQPDMVFVATHLQEPDPAFNPDFLAGYEKVGDITVRGEPRITLYARPELALDLESYPSEGFAYTFDDMVARIADNTILAPPSLTGLADIINPLAKQFGE